MTLAAILTASLLAQELQCASQISFYEARGEETYAAKVAPVIVARNRVLSEDFPDSFCEVMLQDRQFAFVTNGLHLQDISDSVIAQEAWEVAQQAAQDVLEMPVHDFQRPMKNALYFHSGETPAWDLNKIEKVVRIGGHSFYKEVTD